MAQSLLMGESAALCHVSNTDGNLGRLVRQQEGLRAEGGSPGAAEDEDSFPTADFCYIYKRCLRDKSGNILHIYPSYFLFWIDSMKRTKSNKNVFVFIQNAMYLVPLCPISVQKLLKLHKWATLSHRATQFLIMNTDILSVLFWLHHIFTVLLLQILTGAPNVDKSTAGTSPQRTQHFLVFE